MVKVTAFICALGVLICASYVLGAADTEGVEKPSVEIAANPYFDKWCWWKNPCYRTCLKVVSSLCALAPPPAQPTCYANGYKLCRKYNCKYFATIGPATVGPVTKGPSALAERAYWG